MKTTHYLTEILEELKRSVHFMSDDNAETFVHSILEAKKIFVAGAGRSGFMAKSFAMRMMHIGLEAYVVGEAVTPSLGKGDLLIIASGSGETRSLVSMAEKAKGLGAAVALVTTSPQSTIGRLADIIVQLPGATKDQLNDGPHTIQPMGSLFEQTLLLFFDAVILRFMEKQGMDSAAMYGNHANLE
jgi:6-phospho-3-hexuloisomerase